MINDEKAPQLSAVDLRQDDRQRQSSVTASIAAGFETANILKTTPTINEYPNVGKVARRSILRASMPTTNQQTIGKDFTDTIQNSPGSHPRRKLWSENWIGEFAVSPACLSFRCSKQDRKPGLTCSTLITFAYTQTRSREH